MRHSRSTGTKGPFKHAYVDVIRRGPYYEGEHKPITLTSPCKGNIGMRGKCIGAKKTGAIMYQ